MLNIDSSVLDLLRCPLTGSKLQYADARLLSAMNKKVSEGILADQSGRIIDSKVDAALVNQDRSLAMPIRAGVISLAANRAISIEKPETAT